MFNIQPGQGLGFSASKEIAMGLGTAFIIVTEEEYAELISLDSYITLSIEVLSYIES